jgi:high-affinity iron transporter
MFATTVIVFREVLEAGLIISLLLVATRGVANRGYWVTGGVAVGLLLAGVIAMFADVISNAVEGVGQELFNATILFAAVGMLAWHNVWMRRHSIELVQRMRCWGEAVVQGEQPLYLLAIVIGLAVLREGSEVVLFLYGILASGTEGLQMFLGGMLGIAAGVLVGAVLYFGLVRIPVKHLFTISAWLILLLAAGMASQGAAFLVQANMLPALGTNVWDTTAWLSEHSVFGQLLHVLVGYDARPMGIQIAFYLATVLGVGFLMWLYGNKHVSRVPSHS